MVVITIQDGWHINSAMPGSEEYTPTSLDIGKSFGVKVLDLQYPEGVGRTVDFLDVPLNVYEGTVQIHFRLGIPSSMKPGAYKIPAELSYQACSASVCLAPTTLHIQIPLRVAVAKGKVPGTSKRIPD